MPLRDLDAVTDILEAARTVQRYLSSVNRQQFNDDSMRQDAIVRQLEIIGEAAKRVTAPFKVAHPAIPWRAMAGMHDVLIHAYDHVDLNEVWRVATQDIPELIMQIEPIVPPEESA